MAQPQQQVLDVKDQITIIVIVNSSLRFHSDVEMFTSVTIMDTIHPQDSIKSSMAIT